METVRVNMKQAPLFVKKIVQRDNHTFAIEWHDGKVQAYRLSHLQRLCPCAKCYDAINQVRINKNEETRDDLTAERLFSVGRYALRVQFKTGCSKGIYTYAFLREIGDPAC